MTKADLPRTLGAFDATTIVVGSIIGSGIFLKASKIATLVPDPWIVLAVWIVSGILTLFGALTLAELGARNPRAGGLYVYLGDAFGPFVSFLFGWCMLLVLQTGSMASLAAGVAQAFGAQVGLSPTQALTLAGALIVLFSGINLVSVRAVANIQNVFTVAKSLGVLLLIFGAFVLGRGSLANFAHHPPPPVGMALVSAFGLAMVKSLWAYDGWANVSFMAGEVRDPARNLPRALAAGTLFVIFVYVTVNAAYHWVLPVEAIQASKSVARDVAIAFLGASGGVALTVIPIVSMLGTLNSSVLSGPRVYFAMARDRLFFSQVSAIHPRLRTPHVSILVQCAWALVLLARWQTFETLTDNVVFIFWIFYGLGAAAVIRMRTREPHADLPYRTPAYPWLPAAFIVGAAFLTVNTIVQSLTGGDSSAMEALLLLLTGVIAYPFFRSAQRRSE